MTDSDEEVVVRMSYIHYPVWFQEELIRALFNSGSKINAINPDYAWKLGLKIQKTNVEAQKNNGSTLEIFEMVIVDFQMEDKASKPRFFLEIFLVADIKFEVILGMSFLKISNANVLFGEKTLMWRIYTINKALLTTKQVQIIDSKLFVITTLDINSKTFMMHVAIREWEKMPVHFKR